MIIEIDILILLQIVFRKTQCPAILLGNWGERGLKTCHGGKGSEKEKHFIIFLTRRKNCLIISTDGQIGDEASMNFRIDEGSS